MNTIGILYQPTHADSTQLAQQVRLALEGRGIQIWQGAVGEECELAHAAPQLDLLITLGGDGTIVHAVRAVAVQGVPILGVNLGRLGFLAEVEPTHIKDVLPTLLKGQYLIEERMMLHVELVRREQTLLATEVVNEVVAARGRPSRTVRISVDVDGHYVMTQAADGIIVSTPTGSTAYGLAAGGPIVAPDLDCAIIVPIAAHLSMARSIVIPAHRQISLRLIKGSEAMLTLDGQIDAGLEPEDEIRISRSEHRAKFIRFGGDGYFYETVLRRLRWPDRGQIP